MSRHSGRIGTQWETPSVAEGFRWEHVGIEVLMDIRDELQQLNRLLNCRNFTGIPATLRTISRKLPVRRTKGGRA